jgi:hypothetical protein
VRRRLACLLVAAFASVRADAAFERPGSLLSMQGAGADARMLLWVPWTISENPASLAGSRSSWVLCAVSPSPFGLPELSSGSFGLIFPVSHFPISLAGWTTGFSLYRESSASVGLASSLTEFFCVGVRGTLFMLSIADYGSARCVGFDVGATWRPDPVLSIGWFATRVNSPSLHAFRDRIPTSIGLGLCFSPLGWSDLSFDLVQESESPTEFRLGCSLQLHEALTLRVALSQNPADMTWGADIRVRSFLITYRVIQHPSLGSVHSIGLGIRWGGTE